MKITIVGTGYVGLVSGTCFAEMGHEVTCVDIDSDKITELCRGKSPLYEPGLAELLTRNQSAGRLSFTTSFKCIESVKFIFLAVGTPTGETGEANLQALMAAVKEVALRIDDDAIIAIKSTVPVGTSEKVREAIGQLTKKNFYVVNNPEFLKEGNAIEDFMKPDRVVIGHREEQAGDEMEELYAPMMLRGDRIIKMSNTSAEMSKYASNCFLATKISFINDIANLCDLTGADIEEVREVMVSDHRIGKYFLYPGPGYGGSCFPKDVKALLSTARERGANLEIVHAAEQVNERQKKLIFEKLGAHLKDFEQKTIALWGVSFKPGTDDVRESSALSFAQQIIAAGGRVQFYDPVASANFLREMGKQGENLQSFDNMYECLAGASALVLITEWPEFRDPNWSRVVESLRSPFLFDCRNIYSTPKVLAAGLTYLAIGKSIP